MLQSMCEYQLNNNYRRIQLLELYEVCERNDWTVVEEYNETVSK